MHQNLATGPHISESSYEGAVINIKAPNRIFRPLPIQLPTLSTLHCLPIQLVHWFPNPLRVLSLASYAAKLGIIFPVLHDMTHTVVSLCTAGSTALSV